MKSEEKKTALIVRVTGIVGRNLAELLRAKSAWNFIGLARRPFEIQAVGYSGRKAPLEQQMTNAAAEWETLAEGYSLRNNQVEELASWWHTNADSGWEMECFTDMTKSRELGLSEYKSTRRSFLELFERLRADRIIS